MSEPIRVLQIVNCMQNDGVANVIMNIYRKIDRSKVQFDFLVHQLDEKFFDEEIISLGGNIYRVEDYNGDNEEDYIASVNKVFEEHGPFVIAHGHWGRSPHIYFRLAQENGSLTVNHSHNLMPKLPPEIEKRFDYIYKTAVEYSDYFLACSRHVAVYRFGEDVVNNSDRYFYLPNGIDNYMYKFNPKHREEIANEFNLPEDVCVYGHVGRIEQYQKNHEFLIEIFNEIIKLEPNSKLMLVGQGPDKEKLEKKISELGLKDSVIFTGVRGDVYKLLQRMDCFILPSFFEGLAVVGVEALSVSLPCLFSEAMPAELDIKDYIVRKTLKDPASDWAKAAIKLSKLERDPIITDKVAENFNINKTSAWLQNFYLKIANK